MRETEERQPGLFGSLRRLLQLVVQTLHVRIGIFSIELREEGQRFIRVLALAMAFLFLALATLLLVTFAIIFAVWDDPHSRLTALWILCAFYAGGTVVAGLLVNRMLQSEKLPFSDTLRELEKDREWIRNPPQR